MMGVLALAALVAIWQVISIFAPSRSQGTLLTGSISSSLETAPIPSAPDADNDGLSDSQESMWRTDPQKPDTDGDGFLDGEEVLSGHNPLVAAPNDLLPGQSVGQLLTQAFVSTASGSAGMSYTTWADAAAQKALNTLMENGGIVKIQPLLSTDSNADKSAYIQAFAVGPLQYAKLTSDDLLSFLKLIGSVDVTNLDTLTADPVLFSQFTTTINRLLPVLQKRIDNAAAVHVPPSWVGAQQRVLDYLQLAHGYLTLAQVIREDRSQGLMALDGLIILSTAGTLDMLQSVTSVITGQVTPTPSP